MEQLTKHLKKLQEANEESKSVTKASAMRTIKKRMDREISDVGKAVCAIKMKLEEVDRENVENRKKPGCEKGTAVDRSRISMTIPLKKKLKDSMNDFQKLRQSIQNEYREVIKKRVFTVTGTAPTEEMIDELIETGDSEKIFQKAIVGENGREQVIDAVEEIQERNDAIREIEKKMLELQQVFVDMEILIKAQGELLDNIESQVAIAINHIENGVDALETTKSMENKSRNREEYNANTSG
ncbi:hypothetical protein HPP92_000725 [Vanilla planifolia]|uniref:t-SNARE coiled-coil homology domain-containing protein n=1 Tax=Vanilla planifolia TaxID=51239 RepID=A0A835S171_VANPL|nr:hypothetical protein HPP92_000725 [Vanilla planifolia]